MTANPARPSRHFAGKGANTSDTSDSEASDNEQASAQSQPPKKRTIAPPPKLAGPGKIISTGAAGSKPIVHDDAARKAAAAKKLADVERRAREEGFVTESEDGSDEQGSGSGSGSESGSSEDEDEESSSEEEERRRPVMVRPKFLSKAAREAQAQAASTEKQPTEEDTAAQRRAEADALVEAQIQKDLAARLAGKKHWDDDDDEGGSDDDAAVDDTDDIDPAAEYAAWRLRELKRLARAREAIEAKEREIAEKERRQNLSEEARRAEDEAVLAAQQAEKESRGKMGYMQKYFHKGAFYQGESAALGLDKRDLAGAKFADAVRDAEGLPAALQMRDMTRLGRKGASKYKDLKSEDTGSWGRVESRGEGRGQFDRYGDGDRGGYGARQGDEAGGQGANALPLGQRKERRDRSRSRDDRRGADSYRRERSRSRSPRRRDRSRSRSPRRNRDGERDSRKRDYSRERDRYHDDKRRRVEAR